LHGLAESASVHQALIERIATWSTRAGLRLFATAVDKASLPEALQAQFPARLCIPPLRERASDILLFARHFAPERTITPAALQILERYAWPGNLNEPRSVLNRA